MRKPSVTNHHFIIVQKINKDINNSYSMKYASFKETLNILKEVLIKPHSASQTLSKKGKTFLPGALILLILPNLFGFLKSGISYLSSFITTIVLSFISVALIFYVGKWLFKGKGNFWNLFSSLQYINIVFIYALVFLLIIFLMPFIALALFPLGIIFIIYYIILSIMFVSACLKIKGVQSFFVLLVVGIIVALINWGISLLLNLSTNAFVGQAIIGL